MKVNPDSGGAGRAHPVYWFPGARTGRAVSPLHNRKLRPFMLTIAILSLVFVPVALDLAMRGRHRTIELSLVRAK